jgi:hypothetical protein
MQSEQALVENSLTRLKSFSFWVTFDTHILEMLWENSF